MRDFGTNNKKITLNKKTEKIPPRNRNFINSLNNLIAISGMVPPTTTFIPGDNHNARVQDGNTVVPNDNSAVNKLLTPEKEFRDVDQQKARGHMERKLPLKVEEKQNNEQADASAMGCQSATIESPTEESSSMKVMTNISSERLPNVTVYSTDNILSQNEDKIGKILRMEKDLKIATESKMQESNSLNWMKGSLIVMTIQILFNSRTSTVGSLEHIVLEFFQFR